jgi:uncharacterized membrane protein
MASIDPGTPPVPVENPVGETSRSVPFRMISVLRVRLLAGLLLVLPFVITAWIVYSLYSFLDNRVVGPIARFVVRMVEGRADVPVPAWFANYVAPLIGALTVLALLYFLGLFARVRAERILDAILLRLPIITSIHKMVRQVFATLRGSSELKRFRRAVLVAFPHPGMRVPGFVTASCRDEVTRKTILCVYVPTTPVPTSGYMLLVPEQEVTELNWTLEQTVHTVVSFGISAPPQVRFYVEPGKPSAPPADNGVKRADDTPAQ